MLIVAVIAALLAGYVAGLLSFKVKERWCPCCGSNTTHPAREHAGQAR